MFKKSLFYLITESQFGHLLLILTWDNKWVWNQFTQYFTQKHANLIIFFVCFFFLFICFFAFVLFCLFCCFFYLDRHTAARRPCHSRTWRRFPCRRWRWWRWVPQARSGTPPRRAPGPCSPYTAARTAPPARRTAAQNSHCTSPAGYSPQPRSCTLQLNMSSKIHTNFNEALIYFRLSQFSDFLCILILHVNI